MQRGLLGGTFDPPHLAHLIGGEAAYRDLGLDVVTFMPAGLPWQKADRYVSSATDRWEMTRLALSGVSYFEADDREVHRDGWTYTADTLDAIPSDEKVTMILGADAARGLPGWHRYRAIVERADFAIMDRPGVDRGAVEEAIGKPFTWLDTPLLDVSGTMLRKWAQSGHSIRFFVRDAVWEYISAKGLYGSK